MTMTMTMATATATATAIVHTEFVSEGETLNEEFFKGAMDRLLERFELVSSILVSRFFLVAR